MSLNDRQHVEAVAIIRRLMETGGGLGDPEAFTAAEGWLRENQPTTEQYLAALNTASVPHPEVEEEGKK